MSRLSLSIAFVILTAAMANAQVLGLPSSLVARNLFAQTQTLSPTTASPPLPMLPGGLTLEQYAYLSSLQNYLMAILSRIDQRLDGYDQRKQSSDAFYIQRIGEMETKLNTAIENNATSNTTKATATLSSIVGASFAAYAAYKNPQCKP